MRNIGIIMCPSIHNSRVEFPLRNIEWDGETTREW